jgi:hypothetical protein
MEQRDKAMQRIGRARGLKKMRHTAPTRERERERQINKKCSQRDKLRKNCGIANEGKTGVII